MLRKIRIKPQYSVRVVASHVRFNRIEMIALPHWIAAENLSSAGCIFFYVHNSCARTCIIIVQPLILHTPLYTAHTHKTPSIPRTLENSNSNSKQLNSNLRRFRRSHRASHCRCIWTVVGRIHYQHSSLYYASISLIIYNNFPRNHTTAHPQNDDYAPRPRHLLILLAPPRAMCGSRQISQMNYS